MYKKYGPLYMYIDISILNKIMNSILVSSNILANTDFLKTNKHAVAFNWGKKTSEKWSVEIGVIAEQREQGTACTWCKMYPPDSVKLKE